MKTVLSATILFLSIGSATYLRAQESLKNRPTEVKIVFSESSLYKGSHSGRAVARFCGQTHPIEFGNGVKTFLFEYPQDLPEGESIVDVAFNSRELVDGVTTTTKFYVSANVRSPAMGHPPAYVVDTLNTNLRSEGTATLAVKGEEITIRVLAKDSLGAKMDLTVVCKPPQR